ncbi:hypothetical protein HDV03_001928 [Kappamyces sp. JEL0829]|nr:hypothetical protein HDV03_001928 [Kappamyces sp. JEL0829]
MKLNVQIGSWNVATNSPENSLFLDLTAWLEKSLSPSPDLIALGFQELLSQAIIIPMVPSQQSLWMLDKRWGNPVIVGLERWIDLVREAVERIHGQGPKYRILWAGRRAAIGMIILCKEGFVPLSLYTGSIGTGLGGVYGNKGAIGCAIEFRMEKRLEKSSTFTFINAHLCPHEGEANCRSRVDESDHILSSLLLKSFPDPRNPLKAFDFAGDNLTEMMTILPQDAEVIWFFGDLNYRLKGPKLDWASPTSSFGGAGVPTRGQVLDLIAANRVADLVDQDELTFLRKHKTGVLSQFDEAPITFLPTYKFEHEAIAGKKGQPKEKVSAGVSRVYSGKRLPAYCDRVLFYSDNRHTITALHYTRIPEYDWSDHDPVVGLYHLERVEGTTEKRPVHRSSYPVIRNRLLRFLSSNSRVLFAMALVFVVYNFFW